jgi:hypothetical protein
MPLEPDTPFYHAPFPNTYEPGSICWGSTDPRGGAAPETMLSALDLYLEGSFFNNHIAQQRSRSKPRNVMALCRGAQHRATALRAG